MASFDFTYVGEVILLVMNSLLETVEMVFPQTVLTAIPMLIISFRDQKYVLELYCFEFNFVLEVMSSRKELARTT